MHRNILALLISSLTVACLQASEPTPEPVESAPSEVAAVEAPKAQSVTDVYENETIFLLEVRHDTSHLEPGDHMTALATVPVDNSTSDAPQPKFEDFVYKTLVTVPKGIVLATHERAVELIVDREYVTLLATMSAYTLRDPISGAAIQPAFDVLEAPRENMRRIEQGLDSAVDLRDTVEWMESDRLSQAAGESMTKPFKENAYSPCGLSFFQGPNTPEELVPGSRLVTFDVPFAHARFKAGQKVDVVGSWHNLNGKKWPSSEGIFESEGVFSGALFQGATVHSTAPGSLTLILNTKRAMSMMLLQTIGRLDVVPAGGAKPRDKAAMSGRDALNATQEYCPNPIRRKKRKPKPTAPVK